MTRIRSRSGPASTSWRVAADAGRVTCLGLGQSRDSDIDSHHLTMAPNGRLAPLRDVVTRVPANVRRNGPPGSDLAAALSAERRREAERE